MTAQAQKTEASKDQGKGKGVGQADKDKAAAKAQPIARTKPWEDLPANPELQKEPRDKTVLACTLKLLRDRGREGATLEEIKESYKEIGMYHHDPKQLMVWASKNRGWGFHMKKDGKVVLLTKTAE